MLTSLSNKIRRYAAIIERSIGLDDQDIRTLTHEAPEIYKKVKENVEKKRKPFEHLTNDDKRKLLAFVVYKRQNLAVGPSDNPNDEDAAEILHGDVYNDLSDKKTLEELEKTLKKQLAKTGLDIEVK
jgi:hypothetical protein